ncbi:hypothetical protein [Massilia genomosp. 1]|uniref:Beta-ketoacyl synthase N-terminal domain-containing protein n=1 Tax=Massilia genomosp. 1 TaxID=2609280 RepID=A0ABX0MWT9_9BURK|nr:hypothetical protein [Massilia genomosp. 1]NHZ64325.1 hypothetical protein [Massilia genomosp. 1]
MTSHAAADPLLAIRAFGAVTAIGNSSLQTTASWLTHARKLRLIKLDGFSDPFTIIDCHTVTSGLSGTARLAALLGSAVAEAFDHVIAMPGPCAEEDERLELLVLPSWLSQPDCEHMSGLLDQWLGSYDAWCAGTRHRQVIQAGSPGAWIALEHAFRAMAARPRITEILIAAVDSACEAAILRSAAEAGWLLQTDNQEGCIPGEAAACINLRRVGQITDVPAHGFALHRPTLRAANTRPWPNENQADPTALAYSLAGALACACLAASEISHLESDMDGSEWRSVIESAALERVRAGESGLPAFLHPAKSLGQPGAALGLLCWILPVLLHVHSVERVNSVLNWTIDANGDTAACVLERSPY